MRLLPWYIWPLFVIIGLHAFMQLLGVVLSRREPWTGELSGIASFYSTIFYGVCLAVQFVATGNRWTGTTSIGPIPASEFLLVRPISRRTAYLSRLLFFIIVLSPILLKINWTMIQPDLRMPFYHDNTQGAETTDKLKLYQDQFPNFIHDELESAVNFYKELPHNRERESIFI